ncbi:MAG: formimidoylglutamase [Candidatus Xenobium sp.]|jgi:formiminoglutamase
MPVRLEALSVISPSIFVPFLDSELEALIQPRPGEVRVGQVVSVLGASPAPESWQQAHRAGARYALLGIPEDLGPRANLGRPGSEGAWEAFLQVFLNQQANHFLPSRQVLLAGRVQTRDLQEAARGLGSEPRDIQRLRELCSQLDARVAPLLQEIVASGLIPVVIGGGHNNAFPIMQGVVAGLRARGEDWKRGLAVVNCDPHADFRTLEGRHSGNGFSHAQQAGLLASYFVLGLHEGFNSQEMLDRLVASGGRYVTYESVFVRRELDFGQALDQACAHVLASACPVGLELDLDALAGMPSSAQTPNGLSCEEAARFLHHLAHRVPVAWLHLAEGAPSLAPEGGLRQVGKALAFLVSTFLKAG